jgi:hypothetical protein
MPTFQQAVVVRGNRAALFALTQDYGRRLCWDPFLKEARLLGRETQVAVGVRAWCVAWYGLGMETEYVRVSPPDVVAVRMTRGPAILAAFAGAWRFEEAGPERVRVVFRYHLKVRPRCLRTVLEPMAMALFAWDTRLRLQALRRTVEAGLCLAAGRQNRRITSAAFCPPKPKLVDSAVRTGTPSRAVFGT